MSTYGLSATVTGLALLGLIWAEHRRSQTLRWICKPLASVGFVAAALTAGLPASGFGVAVIVALVLSVGGDVFLIPKSASWFKAGLVSFLLGHLGFAAAFVIRGLAPIWALIALPVVGGVGLGVHRWLRPYLDDRMRIPVIAYILVISTMVVLAFGTFGHRPNGQGAVLLGAAVAFFASDLAVARNRFVAPGFVNRLWGLPLYYGAQLAFAWALVGFAG